VAHSHRHTSYTS